MANITKVYLLSVPLEDDYKDTLYFANATAQHTYFAGQVVKSYTDFSYQRKDSVIRVPAQVDTIRNCNYVMYQNSAYSNKWFYAFINRMVYIDDGRTDIYISTDVLQTWMFDMQFKDSFIEREHVNDDTVGKHTIPEGLETGEYVCNEVKEFKYADTTSFPSSVSSATMMACIMVTSLVFSYNQDKTPKDYLSSSSSWNMTNSVPQGLNIIGIPVSKATLAGIYQLKALYDASGRGDAINSMFLMPIQSAWAWLPYTEHIGGSSSVSSSLFYPVDSEGVNNTITNINDGSTSFTIPLNTTLNGYTPKNNKCKTNPFNYFSITNNDGTEISFAYENFLSTPTFKVIGSFEQGGSFMCLPTNSKKTTTADSNINGWTEGIPGGKFPQLSWTSDYYLNWQAQNGKYLQTTDTLNAVNFASNLVGSFGGGYLGSMGATDSFYYNGMYGVMSPDIAEGKEKWLRKSLDSSGGMTSGTGAIGAITNYAGSVLSSMQQRKLARMTPDQAKGNASTGTLGYATNGVGKFTARKMSCKYEYIKAVDDYFSAFGYKVNRLGVPLSNHRQNWWYTKTIQANIDGNIPNEDMQAIKTIYNNGVTYWKNPANIKNYSVSNNIV